MLSLYSVFSVINLFILLFKVSIVSLCATTSRCNSPTCVCRVEISLFNVAICATYPAFNALKFSFCEVKLSTCDCNEAIRFSRSEIVLFLTSTSPNNVEILSFNELIKVIYSAFSVVNLSLSAIKVDICLRKPSISACNAVFSSFKAFILLFRPFILFVKLVFSTVKLSTCV